MFYVNSTDGANIAAYDLNPKGRHTIVLVHGWPLNHLMFEYQIPALLEADFRIVRLDLRGFGNSEETADGYNFSQMATDLYKVIQAMNLKSFYLLGFSMGGAIVTRYMSLFNGYGVKKLCLLDAAVPSYCKTRENPFGQGIEETNKLIRLGYDDRPALNKYFGSIFFARQHSQSFVDWLQGVSDSASGLGEMKCLIALRDENLFNDLKTIRVPTGIIHGREDKICSFKMAELTHKVVRGSVLFPIPNAGHGAFYDQKDLVNKTLINFLLR